MDILGFNKEELIDGLESAGFGAYLGEAGEADVNLFI
jgi:peroxiredoxin family protein